MNKKLPLVVILGSTGSGKTKLSLELAQRFKGEVIGADSMQIYKGLDIITAKATKEEQAVAPHHLIDFLEPHETFSAFDYQNKTLKLIDNLFKSNKVPIVVGGTNYYIESLLWKILINIKNDKKKAETEAIQDFELPSEKLHEKLKLLDPDMARRLHPNNKRKIMRSLEILYQTGKKHSELLEKQQFEGASKTGGGLRYPNALIFKLQCEQEILDERLNRRVDTMIEQGLVDELLNFHKSYNERRIKDSTSPDYTKGVFQSIGLKEFHPYLMLDEDAKKSEEGCKLLDKRVEDLKMVTRRYARRQEKWTRNRFLGRSDRQVLPIYGFDTTDVSKWSENVSLPAVDIIENFINETQCHYSPLPKQNSKSRANAEDETYFCEICDRVFVGNLQWSVHMQSNRHKKRKEYRNKLEKLGNEMGIEKSSGK